MLVRSNSFVVKVRSESDFSGSEINIFGHEHGPAIGVAAAAVARAGAAAPAVAGGIVFDVLAGEETIDEFGADVAVRDRTEADVGAGVGVGTAAVVVTFGRIGDGADPEVLTTGASAATLAVDGADIAGTVAGAVTIGNFPMTITDLVSVFPQTPQLSSTLAVIVYVPGGTPFRSH